MNIWIIAIIGGVVLMFGLFGMMIYLDRKKGNIDYHICQTFLGGQRWMTLRGLVDVKNDGSFLAEHTLVDGGKRPIGLFHQKHLKPSRGNRYSMLLEEWDVGRYRPLEYEGHIQGKSEVVKLMPKLDGNSKPVRDKKGNIEFVKDKEIIDTGLLKATPNHDIDWILRRKEKNRLMILKKDEKFKWLPLLAGGAVLVVAGVILVAVAMYMNDMSGHFETASKNFNTGEDVINRITKIEEQVYNGTVVDRIKSQPPPGS